MFAENRKRLKAELNSTGKYIQQSVIILNKSFTLPKNDDDCDHFPTKFDPYLTWLTGIFYTDINIILHLDDLSMTAFYPKPSEVELCFIKYYDQQELAKFGVTEVIMEEDLYTFLNNKNINNIYFIKGNSCLLVNIRPRCFFRTFQSLLQE